VSELILQLVELSLLRMGLLSVGLKTSFHVILHHSDR